MRCAPVLHPGIQLLPRTDADSEGRAGTRSDMLPAGLKLVKIRTNPCLVKPMSCRIHAPARSPVLAKRNELQPSRPSCQRQAPLRLRPFSDWQPAASSCDGGNPTSGRQCGRHRQLRRSNSRAAQPLVELGRQATAPGDTSSSQPAMRTAKYRHPLQSAVDGP